MRVLVISDIHGNLAALEAVAREPHDAVPGGQCLCVHATPTDPLYRAVGPVGDAWSVEVPGSMQRWHSWAIRTCSLICQFRQPLDGDPRAAYAVLDGGEIELKRTSYPVERTIAALHQALPESPVVATLVAMLRTGRVGAA